MQQLTFAQIEMAAIGLCRLRGVNPDGALVQRGDGSYLTHIEDARSAIVEADAIFCILHTARGL